MQPLIAVLQDGDRNLRRIAAESLGHIGDPQAVSALLLSLDDPHWSVRCAAATALGRIRSPKATRALLDHLADDDATVRRAVVAALGEIGDARAAQRLREILEDPSLQAAALEALRRIGGPALPEIERAPGQIGPEARRLLVNLVGKIEDGRAARFLIQALSDPVAAVRAEAAMALGDAGHLEAVRHLSQLKAADPSPEVRHAASSALRRLGPRSRA